MSVAASMLAPATTPPSRSAPSIVITRQCPCGTAPTTRSLGGARPCVRVMPVVAPLSSTKTSFRGGIELTFASHASRSA